MSQVSQTALSSDIKLLGNLLGQVIREQCGQEAFELVEDIRQTAKSRRSGETDSAIKLARRIGELDPTARHILTKAFSNYFQLINIAEDQQRVRVLRQREAAGRLSESLDEAVQALHKAGFSAAEMQNLLAQLRLRLVLTAHPSEAKRTEILIKLRHIAHMMARRDREDLLPREAARLEARLVEEIEELWQTRATRATTKTVADEVDFGLYFITSVIMDVAIDIYDDLQESLERYYPEADWTQPTPVLRYASWIGGDRDGNPNVTTDVTLETLETQHAAARSVYLQEVAFLRDHLTQSVDEVPVSDALRKAVQQAGTEAAARYPDELYRRQMDSIWQKLDRNEYRSSRELLHDLLLVEQSLLENRGGRVARGELQRMIRKVRLFGLHLAPLEVREDAGLHAAALDEIFRLYGLTDDYLNLPEVEKQRLLTQEIANRRPLFPTSITQLSEGTQRIIRTWQMMAEAHSRYDPIVIDTVIASMSKQPSDVLTMLLLASEVGIQDDLYLVPLFETIDDLRSAPQIMSALFVNPEYRKYLEARAGARGLRQQVMIGYSDSGKDGGYIASNWNLYTAQKQLTETCLAQGVSLELFHGRGGSIGRGGGPANRAILSQPPQSLRGGIKITEQGEVIAYRYINPDIGRRHLHQVLSAVLLQMGIGAEEQVRPEWEAAMEQLSEDGRRAYRNLVYETEGFLDYWQQATPISELSRLQISSRPAKRQAKGGFSAMRAIPWVFSWMQSRAIIPSWYGVGHAFRSFASTREDGLDLLQQMYREWSFFRALVENTQLDVAKADMGIAALYASLVEDAALREQFFGRIRDEHSLTQQMICKVTGQVELLDTHPAIKNSIERRNPYVDPLNFIQVQLLRELRTLPPDTPEYQQVLDAVLDTINGIAAGMKTTG